jgi:hypothetical protein
LQIVSAAASSMGILETETRHRNARERLSGAASTRP